MKEKYIENIIRGLSKYYGYGVINLEGAAGIESNWALVRLIDGSSKRVIIFISESYDVEDEKIIPYLMQNLNCSHVELIKILAVSRVEEANRTYFNCDNVICLDYEKSKILFYGSKSEQFAQELADIMYENSTAQYSKERKRPYITYTIIGVNILAYIVTAFLSGNILDSDINVLVYLGAKYNPLIKSGEYYRLITSMFLHGGIIHLALNMYALNSIGPLIERIYGKAKYLIIYFISGILSSLLSFMFSEGVSIGASGAIFGLLGTSFIFAIKMRHVIGKAFIKDIGSVIVINLIMGLTIPNIDNFGHLGGLIGGLILGFVLYKNNKISG